MKIRFEKKECIGSKYDGFFITLQINNHSRSADSAKEGLTPAERRVNGACGEIRKDESI